MTESQIDLFRSLFKGRDDVFAIRWERDGRSGYMPAYDFNWEEFNRHRQAGGTIQTFQHKSCSSLTDQRIANHLSGKETIGIYPLLTDNTSWFIAADFDQTTSGNAGWLEDCRRFIQSCQQYALPVYLERSRSGEGGHVWLFFTEPCPARKSRKIFTELLKLSSLQSVQSANTSFDRLFPNQDTHSGKGFGNLIALPLQQKVMAAGNSLFIDPETGIAFADQWTFMKEIKRISIKELDALYEKLNDAARPTKETTPVIHISKKTPLPIILAEQILIPVQRINDDMLRFLKENLNIRNPEFFRRKKLGLSTFGTNAVLKTLNEETEFVILPRGFIRKLLIWLTEQKIPYTLDDRRIKHPPVLFNTNISLLPYQHDAVHAATKKDFGVIVAPPGAGKTIIALEIIRQKQQPALIIVHRRQLFSQWLARIESFLGIPALQVGRLEKGNLSTGSDITISMIQSLQSLSEEDYGLIKSAYGTIIVDECHHIPARTFSRIIQKFNSYYLYGLTATPVRKNRDEELIFLHIGEIIHEVVIPNSKDQNRQISIHIQETSLQLPISIPADNFETLTNVLIHDTNRNEGIVSDIMREIRAGRTILVLTERTAHVDILSHYLKDSCKTITLTGEDSDLIKREKFSRIADEDFQVLIATGQYIGEGTDIGVLDCLFLVYPFSFEGKLIQYLGRVQRSNTVPVIYDYRDIRIAQLENRFKQRNTFYRKLRKSGQLIQLREIVLAFQGEHFYINTEPELFPVSVLDLPVDVESFRENVCWLLRLIQFNEEDGELTAEILNYQYRESDIVEISQAGFYFTGIEKIKFRNLDTSGLLRSVNLLSQVIDNTPIEPVKEPERPKEYTIVRTLKIPFSNIQFEPGSVQFAQYIHELNKHVEFRIGNEHVRPEFTAIRDYFVKALKKKAITVQLSVTYTNDRILSTQAKSDDINAINPQLIESFRFEFVTKNIFKGTHTDYPPVQTLDDLKTRIQKLSPLYHSEKDLLDDILRQKNYRHLLHLRYLSSRHQGNILKLRFVLQPFSFLFLLSGEKNYYIIWETLDTDDATYIWQCDKNREALKTNLITVEEALAGIRKTGRQPYLATAHPQFSRIIHDYSDEKKGFIQWKGVLEEMMV